MHKTLNYKNKTLLAYRDNGPILCVRCWVSTAYCMWWNISNTDTIGAEEVESLLSTFLLSSFQRLKELHFGKEIFPCYLNSDVFFMYTQQCDSYLCNNNKNWRNRLFAISRMFVVQFLPNFR